MSGVIRIGARASKLAQIQASLVAERLSRAFPERTFAVEAVFTQGDADQKSALREIGGTGVFVKELEAALLVGGIDLAVHSAKDLPSALSDEFVLAAVPQRDVVEDVLIALSGRTLQQLPRGSRVATSSARRQALIRSRRPDLKIVDVRGNVDTRLRKLHEGQFDALVLARAALVRLNMEHQITQILPPGVFIPAAGQGALAIECRSDDSATIQIASQIDSACDHACLLAERSLLAALKAGCSIPIGAWAHWETGQLIMIAIILEKMGRFALRATGSVQRMDEAVALGQRLAQDLLSQGAAELMHGEN